MTVFVVEERYKDDDPRAHVEGDVIMIATSEFEAFDFVREYIQHTNMYGIYKPSTYWWWIVVTEVDLNQEIKWGGRLVAMYDWNGTPIDHQPIEGYTYLREDLSTDQIKPVHPHLL